MVSIGTDSMGAMGSITPWPKSCGGDALKSPPQEFCYLIFWNSEMYSKNTNLLLYQWQKLHWFQPKNAPKEFGGRASPGPAGGAYTVLPQTS